MKILVTGVNGQLGHDVVNALVERGHCCVGCGTTPAYSGAADGSAVTKAAYEAMDITNAARVSEVLNAVHPGAVIHCAAWTNVDAAEEPENRERVFAINSEGTRNIANASKMLDCTLMYISTDYVFDGQGTEPWQPDNRSYAPLNVYGRSKLGGELAVAKLLERYFIVRTAWLFGLNGKNFVKTILDAGRTRGEVRVVSDQIGTPTYTLDLARLLTDMIDTEKYGYYHAVNEGGYISWYDFAKEIYRQTDTNSKISPVTTAEYGATAARPFNSRLDTSKLRERGFRPLPDWRDALGRYLEELQTIL